MTDVVLVSCSFYPREGGAERQLRSILAQLVKDGFSVAVVTQVIPGMVPDPSGFVDGVRIYRVGSVLAFRKAPRLAGVLFILAALLRTLRMRPTLVLSLQMGTASAAAVSAARILRIPHVLRLTGGGSTRYRSEPVARAASRVGRTWSRLFSRSRTVIAAPALHLLADFSLSFPGSPCETRYLPNGVLLPAEQPEKLDDVVWYGRSGSEQSSSSLLEVADRLQNVEFSVIGQLAFDPVPNNVSLLGWQAEPEAVIGRHRVLLNTSLNEGMPNTVLQAIAWGTYVVGFDNPGMREVQARYPESVALVSPDDYPAAASAVKDALGRGRPPEYEVPSDRDVKELWLATIENMVGTRG